MEKKSEENGDASYSSVPVCPTTPFPNHEYYLSWRTQTNTSTINLLFVVSTAHLRAAEKRPVSGEDLPTLVPTLHESWIGNVVNNEMEFLLDVGVNGRCL